MAKSKFLSKGRQANFQTLLNAAADKRLALMEMETVDGQNVAVLVAIDGEGTVIPLAKQFDGNPFEELKPPFPEFDEQQS